MYKFLCRNIILILLGRKLLGHVITICLTLEATAKLFPLFEMAKTWVILAEKMQDELGMSVVQESNEVVNI